MRLGLGNLLATVARPTAFDFPVGAFLSATPLRAPHDRLIRTSLLRSSHISWLQRTPLPAGMAIRHLLCQRAPSVLTVNLAST